MAFLAGEPDAKQADEQCKREVPLAKLTQASSGIFRHHLITPCPSYIFFWEQKKCTDDYVYLDERGLLWKVKKAFADDHTLHL